MERVTAQNPAAGKIEATPAAMLFQCLDGIMGAGWRETTTGGGKGRDDKLVQLDKCDQQRLHGISRPEKQQAASTANA
jgi:hypothetical protein